MVMATIETLKNEPSPDSEGSRRLRKLLEKQLAGIVPLQDEETGLWHTVLDEPDTYLEGSASSMFLYGMAEAANLKLFDVPWADCMAEAWRGIAETVEENGRVSGVSAGTGPSGSSGYQARDVGTYTWGTGAFLLAGVRRGGTQPWVAPAGCDSITIVARSVLLGDTRQVSPTSATPRSHQDACCRNTKTILHLSSQLLFPLLIRRASHRPGRSYRLFSALRGRELLSSPRLPAEISNLSICSQAGAAGGSSSLTSALNPMIAGSQIAC